MLNGFINLYKQTGISSNKAISILKNTLKENNIHTKVGHFGTLDPLAEGVLPVALGRATRLFDYFLHKSKTYKATFLFGVETDTLDSDGKIIAQHDVNILKIDIDSVLHNLVGKQAQIPPQYSAKSVNGVRAYKLARQGIEVKLQPKDIEIFSISVDKKIAKNTYEFTICCSSGTYVRSIIRDLAALLQTVGIMTALVRTESGEFNLENSFKLDELDNINSKILPMEMLTEKYDKIYLTLPQKDKLLNGVYPYIENISDKIYSVYCQQTLIGIGEKYNDNYLKLRTWLL